MLRINDIAPDFEAETTEGNISLHSYLDGSWGILFSHPKDFTPVCTTELGYMARIEKEFESRNCKLIGLSVDSIEDHIKWKKDIEETVSLLKQCKYFVGPDSCFMHFAAAFNIYKIIDYVSYRIKMTYYK